MNRRDFLKGLSGAAAAGAFMAAGCDNPYAKKAEGFTATDQPSGEMTYREDNKGQKVSLLGFGMMRLPKKDEETGELDQEAINSLVDYAMAHGVNYYDTAPVYCKGQSEKATGIALSRYPREKYLIATKLSNFRTFTREASMKMYQESFDFLQSDHIDYYLLHSFGGENSFKERFLDNGMLEFLIQEREAGRIKNLGWSFHGLQSEFDKVVAMQKDVHWDFAQIQMNYVDWHYAHEIEPENVNADYLYTELDKNNIPVVIMEPLLGGRLTTLNDHLVKQLKERDPNRSIASWAFRYLGSFPRIITCLSGMNKMEHLEDNVRSVSPLQPLTDNDKEFLYRLADEFAHFPAIPCTGCQYCMPCPFGLDIPGIFTHYNKCLREDNIASEATAGQKEFRRARKAYLSSYNETLERNRQADHCIGCGECLKHCPQHIAIPDKMHMIEKYTNQLKDSLV